MKHIKKSLIQALLWLTIGLVPQLAWAVPNVINYQGYLENAGGESLNATINMTFALYDTVQGGSALWRENHQQVTVTNGVFHLLLGTTTPFDDNSLAGERYLGVTVGNDAEMTPRQALSTVPFAMRAAIANSVEKNSVTTEVVVDKAITGDKIADLSGHNVTKLDDVTDAGSGKIISDAEREKLGSLKSSLFQLNGNNAYYTDGNVGIGTTEPQAKLHVDGTIITQKLATRESQKEIIFSVDGKNLFKISRTLNTHPDHGAYERRLEFLGPDDNSQDLGRTFLYGGISLFGDKKHSSVGMGPSISFNSTFPNPSDNRHFYISLGDTWNNRSVSRDDLIIHSWNHLYQDHIQHIVLKANGTVGIGTTDPQAKLHITEFGDVNIGVENTNVNSNFAQFYARSAKGGITTVLFSEGGTGQGGVGTNSNHPFYIRTNGVQRMTFDIAGNVGIGTTNPQYKLDVAGTIRGSNVSPSDQRLKQNIQPLENSLAKVEQLRGVSFEWKDKVQDAGTQIGMIAQEVETVLPDLVSTDGEGYKSLAYDKMTAVLVEAVKELKAETTVLVETLTELKAQNDALKAIVCEDHLEKAICQ